MAEGRVVVEGDQISYIKGKMNPITAGKHVPIEDSKTKEVLTENDQDINQTDYEIICDSQDDCKIVHVDKGDEPIQEMLAKQINYGNKMKYTDGKLIEPKMQRK